MALWAKGDRLRLRQPGKPSSEASLVFRNREDTAAKPRRRLLAHSSTPPEAAYCYLPAFFLPATVRFGPLRVRALVLVRCPRTGRPRRCRSPW